MNCLAWLNTCLYGVSVLSIKTKRHIFRELLMFCRAQTIMKARLKGAQTGRNLLKKKSDALSMRFRQILRKIIEVRAIIFFL